MPMSNNNNEVTAEMSVAVVNARVKVLSKCEGDILKVLDGYKVTTPEAIFMFEKIKFTALHADALRTAATQRSKRAANTTGRMFG